MKQYDVEHLKNYIIDIPIKLCDKSSKNMKMIKCNIKFPQSYFDDLIFLCEQYGTQIKFETNSWCSYRYNDPYYNGIILGCEENKMFSSYDVCRSFCHELSHHIQYLCLKKYGHTQSRRFREQLRYEIVAERLAYFVYKKHFTHLCPNLTHRNFNGYRKKSAREFLKKYLMHNK